MSEYENDYAESWKPQPGNEVQGTLTAVGMNDAGWGPYPIVTLEDEGGTRLAVHAFHDVLKAELSKRSPKIGDSLWIKYLGKPEGKNYHAYKVRGGQEPEFDWAQFGGNGGSAEPPIPSSDPVAPKPPAPAGEQFGDAPPF